MKTPKKILAIGATGQQGNAVAKNLISKKFEVYGLSRYINSVRSKDLQDLGVKMISGNLDDVGSYQQHLMDIDVVFFMQTFVKGYEHEVHQGKQFVKSCVDQAVKHLVYSSVIGADLNTGVPHFESKHVIEKFIQQKNISHTIVRPASFMENFLIPDISKRLLKGTLMMPLHKNVIQQHIAIDDIGKVVTHIISNLDN